MYFNVGKISPNSGKVMGKPATIVYLGGCNWRCKYCNSYKILDAESKDVQRINLDELFAVLQQLKGPKIIEFNGGEPTLQHRELKSLCSVLKQQGFQTKVHTNGSNPGSVGELTVSNSVDFITLDVKAPLNEEKLWREITQREVDLNKVRETIAMCHNDAFKGFFEVVVPVIGGVNDKKDFIKSICDDVVYCNSFVIQAMDVSHKVVDDNWLQGTKVLTHNELYDLATVAKETLSNVDYVFIRSNEGDEMV